MTRDEQLDSLFADTIRVFVGLLKPLCLSLEETEAFEERVFLWFDRFVRRPGNENASAEQLLIPMLSAACEIAKLTAKEKGIVLPSVAGKNPLDVGIQLGLIQEVETP